MSKPLQVCPRVDLKLLDSCLDPFIGKIFKTYEIFESSSSVRISIFKNYDFDYIRGLIESFDDEIFLNDQPNERFQNLLQSNKNATSTNIKFVLKNKFSEAEFLNTIKQLFELSELIKNEKDILIVKLPSEIINCAFSASCFKKQLQTKNSINERFWVFTNNTKLIDLYESI
jgi:hypothetical protein